jgi:hypothetical protein
MFKYIKICLSLLFINNAFANYQIENLIQEIYVAEISSIIKDRFEKIMCPFESLA